MLYVGFTSPKNRCHIVTTNGWSVENGFAGEIEQITRNDTIFVQFVGLTVEWMNGPGGGMRYYIPCRTISFRCSQTCPTFAQVLSFKRTLLVNGTPLSGIDAMCVGNRFYVEFLQPTIVTIWQMYPFVLALFCDQLLTLRIRNKLIFLELRFTNNKIKRLLLTKSFLYGVFSRQLLKAIHHTSIWNIFFCARSVRIYQVYQKLWFNNLLRCCQDRFPHALIASNSVIC